MQNFNWRDLKGWEHRISPEVNTSYPADCINGRLGRSKHTINFLNMPSYKDHQLMLVVEDQARGSWPIYKGPFDPTITLDGIEYCEKKINGQWVRSYSGQHHVDDVWGGVLMFLIVDLESQHILPISSEGDMIYSAEEATVEMYPFVREGFFGHMAVRLDKPLIELPNWYINPRLYLDTL